MKRTLILIALMFSPAAPLFGADTPDFDRLRESYKTAMEKATKPINQTYLAELAKIRDNYTRAAKLDAANKVQAEIDAITTEIGLKPAGNPSPPAVTPSAPETPVAIPANNVNGYKIGPLKKGNVITLSYVSGKWKNDGKLASDNPDADFTERGETTRLVIASGRYKTKPGPVLVMVPPGTAAKPFSYTRLEDVENVVLRINEDSDDYETNPGAVTYKLSISR
jgi:hypothetical protein